MFKVMLQGEINSYFGYKKCTKDISKSIKRYYQCMPITDCVLDEKKNDNLDQLKNAIYLYLHITMK